MMQSQIILRADRGKLCLGLYCTWQCSGWDWTCDLQTRVTQYFHYR